MLENKQKAALVPEHLMGMKQAIELNPGSSESCAPTHGQRESWIELDCEVSVS